MDHRRDPILNQQQGYGWAGEPVTPWDRKCPLFEAFPYSVSDATEQQLKQKAWAKEVPDWTV